MSHITVLFNDEYTGHNFNLSREFMEDNFVDALNFTIDVLKMIGYSESLIKDYLGDTYFSDLHSPELDIGPARVECIE